MKYLLPEEWNENFLLQQCKDLVEMNNIDFGKIRIWIGRKDSGNYLPETNQIDFLIQAFPLETLHWKPDGIKCGVFQQMKLHESPLQEFKNGNSIPYVLAAIEAKSLHLDDMILLSSQNQISELTSSNLFFVLDGKLCTPDLASGCKTGVLREWILENVNHFGVKIEKKSIFPSQLNEVTEIFATNVIKGIVPIRYVQGVSKTFTTTHNEITRYLYDKMIEYAKSVH